MRKNKTENDEVQLGQLLGITIVLEPLNSSLTWFEN